ncbi:MAG: hypothetical protein ACR2ID_07485 [Chthoniobacterales bacterium]
MLQNGVTNGARRTVWRVLLSLLTAPTLVVGFYFPLIGLGYAMKFIGHGRVQRRARAVETY